MSRRTPEGKNTANAVHDAVIVGGGPAGLAAGMHLSRVGFHALLLEKDVLGGQASWIEKIKNYPGFPKGISGRSLMRRFILQARRQGLRTLKARVDHVSRKNGFFIVHSSGGVFYSKAFLWCAGARFKKLGIRGEDEFYGRGIFNAAFDKARRFEGKTVVVAGAGDAALHQALLLARHGSRVYLVSCHRGFRASAHLQREARRCRNIKPAFESRIIEARGGKQLETLTIAAAAQPGGIRHLKAAALFILAGKEANLPFGRRLENQPGFFVAGDAQGWRFRQVAVAGGDALRAAMECERFLIPSPSVKETTHVDC